MNIGWFIAGMTCFLFGQVVRAVRWQLLLPNDIIVVKHRLVFYVSLGSLLNTVLPLHIGDVFRAGLLARNERLRFSVSMVSILIERITDIVAILVISNASQIFMRQSIQVSSWLLLGPAIVIGVWAALRWSAMARKIVFVFSSTWNSTIQHSVLDFFWTIVMQINHARFLSVRYLLMTIAMWLAYFASYAYFFFSLPTISVGEVWQLFHGQPLLGTLTAIPLRGFDPMVGIALSIFLLLPILMPFIYFALLTMMRKLAGPARFMAFLSKSTSMILLGVPSAFTGRQAYDNFLLAHFSGKNGSLTRLGTVGFDDCKIARVFSGGSGAITAVVERDGKLSIRKVAEESGASRLRDQFVWLEKAASTPLPVVPVRGWRAQSNFSYYEMPYEVGAVDMYEWLHSVPFERAAATLLDVVNAVSRHHEAHWQSEEAPDLLKQYLVEKVLGNIATTKEMVGRLIDLKEFRINDDTYSITEWKFLEDVDQLMTLFVDTRQTDIHGDLTIENLIMRNDRTWMIIDPNPTSKYKTRLMDWGKLLQSLHKGYESLNRGVKCEYDFESIRFSAQRSDLYQHLHSLVLEQLYYRFGQETMREAQLHEIIHYLRLLRYKFSVGQESGLLFFGVTCMLIREFKATYDIA